MTYSRSGDHVYFSIRLSGESPGAHHYITLQATGDLDGDSDVDGQYLAIFADKFIQSGP